jgi:outer membrane lipoprotein-sorting protein
MSTRLRLAVMVLGMILVFNWGVQATELTGSEVIARVDAMMQSEGKILQERMIISNAAGQQRTREIQAWNKRSMDKDNMLVRFLSPADVAGTGFLMAGDNMWLYLPALGKVRRIAGHARKGSFMGSDLTYEDMEELGSTGFAFDYDAKLIGNGEVADEAAYALELWPKTQNSSYQKLSMWVSQKTYLPRRIEYYDKDGELLKILTTAKVHAVQDRWVAGEMQMSNVQTGTKTTLEIKGVTFQEEIDDSIFSTRYLERGK